MLLMVAARQCNVANHAESLSSLPLRQISIRAKCRGRLVPLRLLLVASAGLLLRLSSISSTFAASTSPVFRCVGPIASHQQRQLLKHARTARASEHSADDAENASHHSGSDEASRKEMLQFLVPSMAIFLIRPLLSNIDNIVIGRLEGAASLAALGPGTALAEYGTSLIRSLPRATTGFVTRGFARGGVPAAKRELKRTLNLALLCGIFLSAVYQAVAPKLVSMLGVAQQLHGPASTYLRIRTAVLWAELLVDVGISALLATHQMFLPLKVACATAVTHFVCDLLLCFWPCQLGVAGVALSYAAGTLVAAILMYRALKHTGVLPQVSMPHVSDIPPVLEFSGPLFITTMVKTIGFGAMVRTAASLGVVALAAYQVIARVFVMFAYFGEPLSQAAQTKLPALLESDDAHAVRRASVNLLAIAVLVSFAVSSLCAAALLVGGRFFTHDMEVLRHMRQVAFPAVFLMSMTVTLCFPATGSLLAAKDFGFIALVHMVGVALRLLILRAVSRHDLGLAAIFYSLTARCALFLSLFAVRVSSASLLRAFSANGSSE